MRARGLGIGEYDASHGVDNQRRIRSRLQQRAEASLDEFGVSCHLEVGDIPFGIQDMACAIRGLSDYAARDIYEEQAAVLTASQRLIHSGCITQRRLDIALTRQEKVFQRSPDGFRSGIRE